MWEVFHFHTKGTVDLREPSALIFLVLPVCLFLVILAT